MEESEMTSVAQEDKVSTTPSQDSGDDSAVMVEHMDVDKRRALQIISIGTEDDSYAFTYHDDKLNEILSRVPSGAKVAVLSVVGAFRTGKSFLLSWFLRYLHHLEEHGSSEHDGVRWYEDIESLGNDGFTWKAGSDRNTTGIWMWSHPYMLKNEKLAILLVDTQGMFDHETTMALTASIFGLSTLMSSFQIYNVDKRIQEDNLQQLALFTEYARLAISTEAETGHKPFQQVEFLVRDWQHFEEEEDCPQMANEMKEYLKTVLESRDAKDLQETREQITACFEQITCYGLVHPGFAVTKKKYAGDVREIDPTFMKLLDQYCEQTFENLSAKVIHDQELSAKEYGTYFASYASLFKSGANFPEASTMLDATAVANNVNALNQALKHYKETMDRIAGPDCSNFIRVEELQEEHKLNVTRCLEVFDARANFGSKKGIQESRRKVMETIDDNFQMYEKLNESRNPLLGLEVYLVPIGVALASFVVRLLTDWTCSPWSQICKSGSAFFSEVTAVVTFFLVIVGFTKAKQVAEVFEKLQKAWELLNDKQTAPKKKKD